MSGQRTDGWIQTFTGRKFWPLDPRPEDVCIADIAHALSMKCRFTGHCNEFYSVAQHSVLASWNCDEPKWALMHDASEAYLPDVSRPVKQSPAMRGFREIEQRVMEAVAVAFSLTMPTPELVHHIDAALLMTERRDLMMDTGEPWAAAVPAEPLPIAIQPWSAERAESIFLRRFRVLFRAPVDGEFYPDAVEEMKP